MRRYLVLAPAIWAILSTPAAAQVPPRFELGLECVAAATVSTMLLESSGAPQDLQESYSSILASSTTLLHNTAPVANMTIAEVDREVVRRASAIVEKFNALPDEAYEGAVFEHIAFDGGMASCTTLLDEARADGLIP